MKTLNELKDKGIIQHIGCSNFTPDLIRKYQTIITTTENELLELIDIPKSVIEL